MAKATTIKVKLVPSADAGSSSVTRKNSGTMTDRLVTPPFCNLGWPCIGERNDAVLRTAMPGHDFMES
jgi:hypothetical protein